MGLDAEHGRLVSEKPRVAIVGAGPAGLIAAETLARAGAVVTVYERMPSPARKLLMAGRGGLNLTHSEDFQAFQGRYPGVAPQLGRALGAFPPAQLVAWANDLGQETFVGSSGRVFPKAMKASPLVRAWLARLAGLGVTLQLNHRWLGWGADTRTLRFATPAGETSVATDALVLATGGASWPRLGADGSALDLLTEKGIAVVPFAPSNVGMLAPWSAHMMKHEGEPLKRIALTVGDTARRGEAVVTRRGLEGGVVYALGPSLRAALQSNALGLTIDLKPDEPLAELAAKLSAPRGKQSMSTFLRKRLGLAPVAISLLREGGHGRLPETPDALAAIVKAVPLPIAGMAGMERAISSAGGVAFRDLTEDFMLRALPGCFVAGEMLDWDAPTGGYLLQACFATGIAAAEGAKAYLKL